MKAALSELNTEPFTAERNWVVDDVPVLSADVSLPLPVPAGKGVSRRIRRYYQFQRRSFFRYCQRFLFPWAAAEYRTALAAGAPLPCFHAALDYQVTYDRDGLWSLYTQAKEITLPGQTLLTRWGDTWDLQSGYPLPASAFFPPKSRWKTQLFSLAAEVIEQQEAAGTARYREDWRHQLRRTFNSRNYYLTPNGPVFFYPMYALGPAAEGIPTFLFPFAEGGLVLPHPLS